MITYLGGIIGLGKIPIGVSNRIRELALEGNSFAVGAKNETDKLFIDVINQIEGSSLKVYAVDESLPPQSDFDDDEASEPEEDKAVIEVSDSDKCKGKFAIDISDMDTDNILILAPRKNENFHEKMYRFSADDRTMLKEAEHGLFIWDGEDERIYMNILELVYYKKPVEVAISGELIRIDKPEDLNLIFPKPDKLYTRKWDALPEDMYEKAVNTVIPSKYMRDYLLSYSSAPKDTVIDLIIGAPVTVMQKLELMEEFAVTDDEKNELKDKVCDSNRSHWCDGVEGFSHDIYDGLFKNHVNIFSEVLDGQKSDEGDFFVLKIIEHSYPDEKVGEFYEKNKNRRDVPEWEKGEPFNRSKMLGVFQDYDKSVAFLKDYIKKENVTLDSLCWFKLEKWVKNPDYEKVDERGLVYLTGEEFDNPYTYYFVSDDLVYFSKNFRRKNGTWFTSNDYALKAPALNFLNLPAPYKAGDIVKIDCRPFAPVTYALMLNDGTERDFLTQGGYGLFRTYENKWKPHFFSSYHPFNRRKIFSSYYGVSEFVGELPEEYKVFKELQQKIGGDRQKAKKLLFHIMSLEETDTSDGLTDEEFFGLIKTDWENTPAPDMKEIGEKWDANMSKALRDFNGLTIDIEIDMSRNEKEQ